MSVLKFNLICSIFTFFLFVFLSVLIASEILPYLSYLALIPIYIYLIHNLMNFVHQASHNLLSKNRKINNFLGYIYAVFSFLSFAEFKKSHILHHAHTSNPLKDPDYELTNGVNVLLIPFFIWKKDVYFIKNKLWGKNRSILYMYIFERSVQILFLAFLIATNSWFFLAVFSLSQLVVGYLNSFFLFFFPHYSLKIEDKIKSVKFKPVSFLFFLPINISRDYHELHHKKIKSIHAYYPVEHRIISNFI